jgi:hypothetical protein
MKRFRALTGILARRAGGMLVVLGVVLWAPSVHAYPMYDDGAGNGCVSCHNGFQGGTGTLHARHRIEFGVATCNLCHPSGGGTTPVRTYWSGPGGGYGCAGCHGQDYGETSPNSGQPKATAYGLRLYHVAQGVTACGAAGGCHLPGQLGHPNPFPTPYTEDVAPPYYSPIYSNLTDPCSSVQEDLTVDADSLGLDNDGNGLRDYPADPNCAAPLETETPTPTPSPEPPTATPTLGVACGTAPALTCIAPAKGSLIIDEKTAGKEKLKVSLSKLVPAVSQSQFGDPAGGSTVYRVCIYDGANQLQGTYTVARAGQTCGDKPCWAAVSDKGYKYKDKAAAADGVMLIKLKGGDAGKGKVKVKGKGSNLPAGIAAALQNQTSATVQILSSDASCFGVGLTQVKKADGVVFSATGP